MTQEEAMRVRVGDTLRVFSGPLLEPEYIGRTGKVTEIIESDEGLMFELHGGVFWHCDFEASEVEIT